jgi:hypothetical protein
VVVVIPVRCAVVVDLVEVLLRRRCDGVRRWRCGGGDFFNIKKFFPQCIRKLSGKGKDTETAQTT